MTPAQGDIWWAEAEEQRRPVLVVTRSEAMRTDRWGLSVVHSRIAVLNSDPKFR